MSEWAFRWAEPTDAEAFARWVTENPQIDWADANASLGVVNPTVMFFVATEDGVPRGFAPIYWSAVLGYLGFDPQSDGKTRLRALQVLKDGVMALLVQYGVREIQTLSEPQYGIAKWALEHGFTQEPRKLFRLDVNKEMGISEV